MCVSMYNKVTIRTRTYGHELVLSSRRLVHLAADDDFVIWQKERMDMSLLPSQSLVHPAADDDFLICRKARMNMCLC